MIGNLMKHNDQFYDILKKNKNIFENLVRCCQIDELNVRKVIKYNTNKHHKTYKLNFFP